MPHLRLANPVANPRFLLVLPVLILLLALACSPESTKNKGSFSSIASAVAALDQHTVSDSQSIDYQSIGAIDGAAYILDPGPFQLRIYLFKDHTQMHRGIDLLDDSVRSMILGETDTLLLITDNTVDPPVPTYPEMDLLVADFLD